MQKRVLIIENYNLSHYGLVGRALEDAGIQSDIRQMWAGAPLPDVSEGFDGLVVLGGEQSAVDDEKHPYLPALANLMAEFGAQSKAVLGICLGSQLLARAHGGQNLIGAAPEFGWQTVHLTEEGQRDPVLSTVTESFPIFQWHDDTFTLPADAVHLATNRTAANQCFRIGRASYGMQFHFEADRSLVETWNKAFSSVIERKAPDWLADYEHHAATAGVHADVAGMAIAKAWVGMI
ncbi:MAG: hypothetical protein RLZZ444_95 [Pseudomonadota bacterium]|jgi:GMP synthase-like glutamine amidotransferase